ncbi:MAG: hypothetical protein KA059_00165 [Elusimicrobiales bacterium]|nr:hypothetical protein [Elusimicrobiales bacterium]
MKNLKKIYLFLFIFFIVLMVVYLLIQRKYSSRMVITPPNVDYAAAQIAQANRSINDLKRAHIDDVDTTTVRVYDSGSSIKIVKNDGFGGVSEKPVDPFTQLAEMAKEKNKVYVNLKESDLDKKINLYADMKTEKKLKKVVVPEMGKEPSSITPIDVPCDYKIFQSSSGWKSFTEHNRIREKISDINFNKEQVVILISKSDIAQGVFKIDSVSIKNNTATISYRVNVFEISDDNPDAKRDFYTAAKIPKNIKNIELKQIQ